MFWIVSMGVISAGLATLTAVYIRGLLEDLDWANDRLKASEALCNRLHERVRDAEACAAVASKDLRDREEATYKQIKDLEDELAASEEATRAAELARDMAEQCAKDIGDQLNAKPVRMDDAKRQLPKRKKAKR